MRVQFYPARPESKNETAIVASINNRHTQIRIGTGISIDTKYWDHKSHRAKNTPAFREGSAINTRLDKIQSEIKKCFYDYVNDNNAEPSPATFRKLIDEALGRSKKKKLIDETPNKGNKHAIGYVIADNAEDKPEQVRKINMKIAEVAIIRARQEMEENINLRKDLQHRYNYILMLRKKWKSLSPYPEFVDNTDVWLDCQLKTLAEILATKDKGDTDTKKPSTHTRLK